MLSNAINQIGKTYQRPWGTYKTLDQGKGYQVKIITVNPGGQLSLQRHRHRAEHWVVIKGNPTITLNDDIQHYEVNDVINIKVQDIHRLENFTDEECAIIEVQIGNYLGEDDIERLDDIYGRD